MLENSASTLTNDVLTYYDIRLELGLLELRCLIVFADVNSSVSTSGKLKNCLTAVGIEPAPFRLL